MLLQIKHLLKNKYILFVILFFIIRLAYGLTNEFWFPDEDCLQIYLIGLKFFTTGEFPFYGADLVYTGAQIPGALQGLLVAAGWYICKAPETPYIILNLLLTCSLSFLAWYISKRIQKIPKLLIWLWVFFTPWSICYFTRIINPSYVVPGAILFFIGVFEIYPFLTKNLIPKNLAYLMIGFGFFWIFQLHLSWVLLIPYILGAIYFLLKSKEKKIILSRGGYFLLGCAITFSTLAPTYLKFGFSGGSKSDISSVASIYPEHLLQLPEYLTKFLAYSSFDVTRFIGGDSAQRITFLKDYIWAAPATIIIAIFGIIQLILLLLLFFKKKNISEQWRGVKYFTLSALIFMWLSSMFSVATPGGHTTVLLFPIAMLYSAHCLEFLFHKKYVKVIFGTVFCLSLIMYTAIAIKNYGTISIYKNREAVVKALSENDYRYVGLRRYEKIKL